MNIKLSHAFVFANIIWILVIFILCAIPGEDIPDVRWNIPHLDKVVHFGMYFILSLLLVYPLEKYTSLRLKTIFLIVFLVSFIYGGIIELLQHYLFNRSGDLWDLSADILGGLAGYFCYPVVKRIFPFKNGILP